ncbi:hypothetical protein [Silvanigrella aquatica]|uniref:Uncharacterized protein n=1 Tax=Silvanigrella aquatica TaxID=1915309 RepID=A0A1L4CXM3_9BACT|nr:hypothetical protein [Silvanigrella aquatica]APJ02695.1 hypothetical protein AXG55_01610 [Silvanigrella aquatica]
MNQEYGNWGWEIFVYPSYIVVAIILLSYIGYSYFSLINSLKDMRNEGYFENNDDSNFNFSDKSSESDLSGKGSDS